MDNKLIDSDVVERYVLNQLGDDELALFRGRMMFDEGLQKEVVQTKMMLNGLKSIATQTGVASQPSSPTGFFSTKILSRAVAAIGTVILIGSLAYFWNNSSDTNNNPKEEIIAPTENKDRITPTVPAEIDDKPDEQPIIDKVENAEPAPKAKPTPKTKKKEEGLIFASSSKKVIEFSDVYEEDEMLGYGNIAFAENAFLEDAIDNSTLKSDSPVVILQLNREDHKFQLDKKNKIELALKGQILTKTPNSNYILKFYSNKEADYMDDLTKYKERLTVKKIKGGVSFKLDLKIRMPEGLYYYVIEEEKSKDEGDMIHAGKIIVVE